MDLRPRTNGKSVATTGANSVMVKKTYVVKVANFTIKVSYNGKRKKEPVEFRRS